MPDQSCPKPSQDAVHTFGFQPLSKTIQQRLDQQVENFLQQWLPKLDQRKQFRQVFDGLMQMGQCEASDRQRQSQHMLMRSLAKLKQQNLSQQIEQHLQGLQQIDEVQNQWWKKLWRRQRKVPTSYSELQQGFYQVLKHIDDQQSQLQKDNLYLKREIQQMQQFGQDLQQYHYLTLRLSEQLGTSHLPSEFTVQQAKQELIDYLTRKQHDILQQQQLVLQSLSSMQWVMHNNQQVLESLQQVELRIQPMMHALAQIQKNQYRQQDLSHRAQELKHAIAVYQQWLEGQDID